MKLNLKKFWGSYMTEFDEKKRPFFAFAAASAAWLLIAFILGWTAESPDDCSGTFSCLSANEWGDYLAGVFAPLAFLWLIAAVVLQSRELAAQREELNLTRQEMKDQRKVMKEQADEARNQAEFIGVQTQILERQEATARRKDEIERLNRTLSDIGDLIRLRFNRIESLGGFSNTTNSVVFVYFTVVDKWDRDKVILEFSRFLRNAARNSGLLEPFQLSDTVTVPAAHLANAVTLCLDLAKGIGSGEQNLLERLEIPEMREALLTLLGETAVDLQSVPNEM